MPDSVNTANEEIRPFAPEAETVQVDTTVRQYTDPSSREDITTTTVSPPDSEEKEPPLVLRSIPDSVIRQQKKDRDFAYANDPSWWKDKPERRDNDSERAFYRLLDSKWFRWFIYMFLACVLLYALYKIIAENNLRFFYRSPSKVGENPLGEAATLPEEDLNQLLKKALDEKVHRMATRYLYLKTLRMLEARQLIRWHIQATDEEYARQLDKLPQGESFRWLMAAYERVWYGKFLLNDQQFSRLLQHFQDFHTSIDHSRGA
jgi:hypothetical protein